MNWKLDLALVSCALLGLRHGFDYDHLAAISDITAVQRSWGRGMRLGLTYALGHALTVVVLGAMVVLLHIRLPTRLDGWTERLIGVTLIVLGVGVAASLMRHVHTGSPLQSRLAVAISGLNWLWWRTRRLWRPEMPRPRQFRWDYNGESVFGIGVLHGLGGETPSQLMLFLLTASLGGTARGMMGLAAFAIGLIAMNAVMTASLGGIFGAASSRPRLCRWVAVAGAIYSIVVGVIFLAGASDRLPPLGS